MRLVLLLLAALIAEPVAADSLSRVRRSVYKIRVSSQSANFASPWKKDPSGSSSGTGFYIGDGRILTNAHVVAEASFITIQRDGDARPEPAYVRFIAHDSDLAILEVKDADYFDGVMPLKLGSLPRLRSPVSTVGFPTGGEQISITQGIVSRVDYRRYVHHGDARHILVQVDSAINPGNSGGPVLQGPFVVGVAFQSFTRAENTGYIIPTPVVRRFLKDIEDGTYDGHPDDGLTTAEWTVNNPSTAAFYGLTKDDGGVQVVHVAPWAPTHGRLLPGDIILAIEGMPVGVDGKVEFHGERVDFRTVFDLKQIGDRVEFRIARDGKRQTVIVDVAKSLPHHHHGHVYARYPKYFVWGGLIFTTLSRSYLKSWGDRWYKNAPLLLRYLDFYARFEDAAAQSEDIIVLAGRLPHEVNAYATSNLYGVVTHVDNVRVQSMAQLAEVLEKGKAEFAQIQFWGSDDPIVLSRERVAAAQPEILQRYGVEPDRWLHGLEKDGAIGWEAVH